MVEFLCFVGGFVVVVAALASGIIACVGIVGSTYVACEKIQAWSYRKVWEPM